MAMLLLSASLVLAQGILQSHHHDGSLLPQYECDICLKVNTSDQALASSAIAFHMVRTPAETFEPFYETFTRELPAFAARAPPTLI